MSLLLLLLPPRLFDVFVAREIFVALAVIYQTYLPEEYSEGSCEPLALIP